MHGNVTKWLIGGLLHQVRTLLDVHSANFSPRGYSTSVAQEVLIQPWTQPIWRLYSKTVPKMGVDLHWTTLILQPLTLLTTTISPIFSSTKVFSKQTKNSSPPMALPQSPLLTTLPITNRLSSKLLLNQWSTWVTSVLWQVLKEKSEPIARKSMEVEERENNTKSTNTCWILMHHVIFCFVSRYECV